jgi:hypothetical protein
LGTADEADTISKNRVLTGFFGAPVDFPDNSVNEKYLGFERTFNENLNFATAKKGLSLYKEVRSQITTQAQVPAWVQEVIYRVDALQDNVPSILRTV